MKRHPFVVGARCELQCVLRAEVVLLILSVQIHTAEVGALQVENTVAGCIKDRAAAAAAKTGFFSARNRHREYSAVLGIGMPLMIVAAITSKHQHLSVRGE